MTETPFPQVRCIVTGVDEEGRSRVVRDGRHDLTPTPPLGSVLTLWADDGLPVLPADGRLPETVGWMPPPGGARLMVWTKEPEGSVPAGTGTEAVAAAEVTELYKHGGMHQTDSVDWVLLISGRVSCEMDGGDLVELSPGDILIQNGTRHRWRNIGDTRAMLLGAVIGADRQMGSDR